MNICIFLSECGGCGDLNLALLDPSLFSLDIVPASTRVPKHMTITGDIVRSVVPVLSVKVSSILQCGNMYSGQWWYYQQIWCQVVGTGFTFYKQQYGLADTCVSKTIAD